jgi:hypothetical protein
LAILKQWCLAYIHKISADVLNRILEECDNNFPFHHLCSQICTVNTTPFL